MHTYASPALVIRDRSFDWGSRTYVMGIINLSPESFSGDGVASADEAVAKARQLAADGADIIDVGGQSTRPGFEEISVKAEIDRLAPAVRAIVAAIDLPVSVDTYRAAVATAALEAGANMINDIWGVRRDFEMPRLVAAWKVPAVVMHNQRGRPSTNAMGDLMAGLEESLSLAQDAGVKREQLIIDPGFGFGWTVEQNLELLRRLGELRRFELPVLIGTSRKSTIGSVLGLPEDKREWGTAATVAVAIANGADIIRVHDVAEMVQVCRMTDAIVRSGG